MATLRLIALALMASLALSGCGEGLLEDGEAGDVEVNPSGSMSQGLSMPACGTALATFDGTTAYSNGAYTGTGTSCAGVGSYGYRYQCVELVMRHFKTKWGLRWWGNAKDLLNNAPRASVDVWYNGDGAHPPVPGDMVVWQQGTYGHVALVTAVRPGAIDIIEQNVVGTGSATLSWDGQRIGARWGTWVPQGWAHAKDNTNTPPSPPPPPPPPGVNWSCGSSSYGGNQYWTCRNGDRYRCEAGVPVMDDCQQGCFSRSLGQDDLCKDSDQSWSCAWSSYRGNQYWTCGGGKLHRCESGVPVSVTCPVACVVNSLGTNDYCR